MERPARLILYTYCINNKVHWTIENINLFRPLQEGEWLLMKNVSKGGVWVIQRQVHKGGHLESCGIHEAKWTVFSKPCGKRLSKAFSL